VDELAPFQLEVGPIPFYHQVYLDLRSSIDDGRWTEGHRIAPERELAEQYGVSVITVRRALGELAREQRIERTRGRGTFVLSPRIDRDLDEPLTFTEEMQRRGLDPQTRLIAARQEEANEAVAAGLQLRAGAPTIFIERLRLADGQPLLLEQVHVPAERFPGLLATDLERQSLYGVMTSRYGVAIARTRETFEPVLLRKREASMLAMKKRQPALLVEGVAFSADGQPVEFSRTFVRGDRTRYFVERNVNVSRRPANWTNQPSMSPASLPERRSPTTDNRLSAAPSTAQPRGER
jgi:GntR family transcriptional regulator, N-acetylglucosamine utilization regulator